MYVAESDPLCYPGTTVLINLPNLRTQPELDDFEFSMYLSRAEEPLPAGELDYRHYRAIQHHLFQDVYSWAGQPRTIRIAKGSNWFCYPEFLDAHMAGVFQFIENANNLVGSSRRDFAANAAHVLAEINAGHPFREGNGRTQLAFLKVLALNAGWPFNDDIIEPRVTLDAMIRSFEGDLVPLGRLIAALIA